MAARRVPAMNKHLPRPISPHQPTNPPGDMHRNGEIHCFPTCALPSSLHWTSTIPRCRRPSSACPQPRRSTSPNRDVIVPHRAQRRLLLTRRQPLYKARQPLYHLPFSLSLITRHHLEPRTIETRTAAFRAATPRGPIAPRCTYLSASDALFKVIFLQTIHHDDGPPLDTRLLRQGSVLEVFQASHHLCSMLRTIIPRPPSSPPESRAIYRVSIWCVY